MGIIEKYRQDIDAGLNDLGDTLMWVVTKLFYIVIFFIVLVAILAL